MWKAFIELKGWKIELAVFSFFLGLFILLGWRLFAFGSDNQLFLYGDNLVAYNNLYYLFTHFQLKDVFGTFIGQSGMLGNYPMSEPQNSLFYLPITILFIVFRLFHLDVVGLYYELLMSHTLHFVLGTYFVYRITKRFLALDFAYAVAAGLIYMGIGWNVAWFGTATLSYMVFLIPFAMYTFLSFLRSRDLQSYAIFVLALTLFLYGGGIVNFFFALLLNLFALYVITEVFRIELFTKVVTVRQSLFHGIFLFLGAPLLALGAYALQLFQTYRVSQDISHSDASYDYLAYFGTHLYDLVGLVVPKFALMKFGSITNPDMILDYSLANIMYCGILPLLLVCVGVACLRKNVINSFLFLAFLSLALSFGGAFFLYDATYFFPGNGLFRGHYKYLMFVGFYLSLIAPLVLVHFREAREHPRYQDIERVTWRILIGIFFLALLSSFAAVAFKYLVKTFPDVASAATLAVTFSSYFFRMALFGALTLVSLLLLARYRNKAALSFVMLVFLLDTSINYKYEALSETPIRALTDNTFFECCQGKTVLNDIDRYSQLYYIPEILGVNPLYQYSAIPNAGLVEYHGHVGEKNGFSAAMLAAAGVEGVLTTRVLDDPSFTLESTKTVNTGNFRDLYVYSADGNIHNEWGGNPSSIGVTLRYYSVADPVRSYYSNRYKEKTSAANALDYVESKEFDRFIPALAAGKKREKREDPSEHEVVRPQFLRDDSTYKKLALHNQTKDGVFFINIPYARVWQAKVNGKEVPVQSANGAFLGIKVKEPNAIVEVYVGQGLSFFWLVFSVSIVTGLCLIALFPQKVADVFGWAKRRAFRN